jgi:hypothetical protein
MGRHRYYCCIVFANNAVVSQHLVVGRDAIQHALRNCDDETVYHIRHMDSEQSYTIEWKNGVKVIVYCYKAKFYHEVFSILYYNCDHRNYGPEMIALVKRAEDARRYVRHISYTYQYNVDGQYRVDYGAGSIVYVLHKHDLSMDEGWVLV